MALAPIDTLVTETNALETALQTDLPVLLFVWNGDSLRSDVKTELEKVAKEQDGKIRVVKVDASKAPELAERFELGKHPIILGLVHGETIARRSRPWGTDVVGMVEALLPHVPVTAVPAVKAEPTIEKAPKNNKPVVVTDETFQTQVLESKLPVLVDFWAEWCGPCKMVAPILDKLAGEFAGKIRIAKVDVDANQGLSQAFRIMSIPTMMFVKNGKIVGQQAGALPEHVLRDAIKQLIALKV
jgi:thioredoxin 1